ncbi:adenosine deaminase [Actinokineospora sp. NBRC 105648]|uniref:adenosine deaminase n=1 Tax=Actinokineospora sp. NBRC 105648 TaxID=3032206 RepID=UPI0024A14B10|nr:adenosine deaminase [Actinokineospora sp. NBRC 105648]GLZ38676.1 adenosine deaminase [Actinokineospora sp. NBRC 105648]
MIEYVRALPKVELHLHLVGSATLDTVLELARRHPEHGVPTDRDELARFYDFTDFLHFITVYGTVNKLVKTGADVTTLVLGAAAGLAAANASYAEITVTPFGHLSTGIDPEELTEALTVGRKRALDEHGVALAWIYDIPGGLEPPSREGTIDWVLRHRPEGSVGFGLGGMELGVSRAAFRRSFDLAASAGLHAVPHAGETVGPEEIWAALRELNAVRIGHGVSAVQDPLLLRHLAEHNIPLEVCPTSNQCTRAVPDLTDHPLPRLLEAGVPVTLATDDPGMFHTDLDREYLLCHELFGLSRGELADIARTGVRAAFCGQELKDDLLGRIHAVERAG